MLINARLRRGTRAAPVLVSTDAPSAEEIDQAHHGWIRAAIRAAQAPLDAAAIAKIAGLNGGSVKPNEIYSWRGAPTNNRLDTYFTHMSRKSLDRYARQAAEGRAVLISHDWTDLPVGQSYAGEVIQDGEDPDAEEATARAAPEARDRTPPGPPLGGAALMPGAVVTQVTRAILDYYMIRGLNIGKKPNDELIRAIETGTLRDLSIGFNAGRLVCDICGNEIFSRDCPHIPGVKYAPDDSETGYAGGMPMMFYSRAEETDGAPPEAPSRPAEVLATAEVEDGDLLETSFAFDGATPEAQIIPAKVRLVVATNGRLARSEARDLAALEYRMGVRLAAPEFYLSAGRTHSTPPRRDQPMVVVTKAVGGGARRRAGTRQDPPAADDGGTGGDASGLSDLILQQAESQAEAIADRIDALDQRTAAVSAEVDATNEQIAALANSEDPAAGDLAAAANALVTAYQAELEGLNADRAAAVAELAAINGTISGLGGTPVDPPADPGAESGASSGSDAGAGTGTTSNRTGQARGGAVVAVSRSQIALRRTPPPPARRARATRQDAPAATGDPSTDVAALAEVIATQATDQATAQADAITALDAEIAALEDQLAASQAALDALRGAEAPDQAAIDAEQANYDSIQTQLDAKRADRDAAAAELDAINETATETGGEPAAVPAEGAAPGGGMGAGAGGTLAARLRTARPDQRVAAGLLIMRRIVQGQIAPNRLNARAVDSGTIQQIIDQVTAVQSALQQVLTDLGSEPARTVQDRAVWSILGRAATEAGARGVSIAMVRQLTLEAHAGRAYRRALIDLTVAARVSALGADRANAETYRTRLEAASLDAIEDDYESYTGKKADLFRPGRQVPSRAAATETATRPRPEAPQAPAGGGAEATFPDGEENLFRLAGAYRRDGGGTR